jgi:AcrR family transcriptional regulator
MTVDPEATSSSRARLLAAAKHLMAEHGYEQASTAAIAREAATSESQLIRNFGGKAGLLDEVFNTLWRPLTAKIQGLVAEASDAREAIEAVLSAVIAAFGEDQEVAFLFLFEGRRVRGDGPGVSLSKGFIDFLTLLQSLVRRGKRDGSIDRHFEDLATASALLGAAEGMIRERLIAERSSRARPFSDAEIRSVFHGMLLGLALHAPVTSPAMSS